MSTPPTLRSLRITRRAADRLRSGHLWVYRTDVESRGPAAAPSGGLLPGELVTLTDSRDIPLGTALYSSASQIAARLISRTPALSREQYLSDVGARIAAALDLRRTLAPITAENNAHRLIFSEADDLPGIVADRYNNLVLLQLLTQGTAQDDVRRAVVEALRAGLAIEGETPGELMEGRTGAPQPGEPTDGLTGGLTIWERSNPRIRELEQLAPPPPGPLFTSHNLENCHLDRSAERAVERPAAPARSGDNLNAEAASSTTIFTLNGLRFHYDAASGQKTGAFLDQRLNYAAAARAVAASGRSDRGLRAGAGGPRGLDICTYQGGFALHLAQVCAQVTGVDASRSALEAADRNLLLNPDLKAEVDWIEADAFEYLRHLDDTARAAVKPSIQPGTNAGARSNPHLFDAIVLDPPAFAKSKRASESALRGYKELNLRALRLLAPGGTLITCSCSHHVLLADFTAIVAAAASDAGRRVQLLETHAAAPDHPEVLTLPETRYLKCLICRVD